MPTASKITVYLATGDHGIALEERIKQAASQSQKTLSQWVVEAILAKLNLQQSSTEKI